MVSNLWKNTTLVCANHMPERTEMTLDASGKTISYNCPLCKNSISVNDFEKIMSTISKIHIQRHIKSDWGYLTGEKFVVSKVIKCEIIEHSEDDKYSIAVLNPKTGGKNERYR